MRTARAWLDGTWLVVSCVAMAMGAAIVFVVCDVVHGALAWAAATAALVAVPLGIGALARRVALRFGRVVSAPRAAWRAAAPSATLSALLLCVLARDFSASALTSVPARYPGAGVLGDAAEWLGRGLGAPHDPHRSATPWSPGHARRGGSRRFDAGDATYREPGCDALPNVSDLASSYRPDALRATVELLAARRYPDGFEFVRAQDDRQLAIWFTGAASTFDEMVSRFDAAVHEGSHIWGAKRFNGRTQSYSVRKDLTIEARLLQNFHRSEILTQHVDRASDSFAKTYLLGASGAQGFNTLLDEYNAYAHGLAARTCTRDRMPSGMRVSARDGMLTMMYYVGVYLRIARTKHAADHDQIMKDPGHRRLILTVWDRAEFWLRKSANVPGLGIRDDRIAEWAYAADNLAEIARVRAAHAQAGNGAAPAPR
jgi:hypothetical protein